MPNLTDKELKAIDDHMSAEKMLVNKYRSYAAMTTDPQIKNHCENIATRHQSHFDRLMGHLHS